MFANGNRVEADAALKKLIDEDADDAGSQIATVYALRKEPNKMFRVAGARLDDARRGRA